MFTFIKAPNTSPDIFWGKWHLPEDCENLGAAQGRHISELRFDGIYKELIMPSKKDFPSVEEWRKAVSVYNNILDSDEGIEVHWTSNAILFLQREIGG